jgi:hypothetical protein
MQNTRRPWLTNGAKYRSRTFTGRSRAHGPAFVISLLRGMVLGRFSFAAFCLLLSFSLPYQRPFVAFAEASVLAMLVQWGTKQLAISRRTNIAEPTVIATD